MLFLSLRLYFVFLGLVDGCALRWRAGAAETSGGQSLVEYAIGVALVAVIAMAAVKAFGTEIGNLFNRLISRLTGIG